jgi:hypothetical protein
MYIDAERLLVVSYEAISFFGPDIDLLVSSRETDKVLSQTGDPSRHRRFR